MPAEVHQPMVVSHAVNNTAEALGQGEMNGRAAPDIWVTSPTKCCTSGISRNDCVGQRNSSPTKVSSLE